MKNKRSNRAKVFSARIMLFVVVMTMTITMLLGSTTIASGDNGDSGIESAARSNFFLNLIGSTVSALKIEENKDDRSFIGQFTVNALEIVNKEISFLDGNGRLFAKKDEPEIDLTVKNISINPFKLKDGSINRVDEVVSIVGDPIDNSKKKILIIHTHTNEAYAEGNGGLSTTVAAVGDVLTDELEKLGFTVIHDKTVHDMADYNRAYDASRVTLNKYLSAYGDFDLIIDLHRDGGPAKENVTAAIDGNSVARLMLVTTKSNPRYAVHRANMESIIGIANELYPGLFRDGERALLAYNHSGINYYNQDLSDNAILMEVGADVNNLQEAKNSMLYMSKVIAQYLNTK